MRSVKSPRRQLSARLKALSIGLAIPLLLAGCSSGSSSNDSAAIAEDCEPVAEVDTINEGELTVLVSQHPPFVSMSGNQLQGIEGELINKIAQDLCLELNVSPTSFTAVIEGLQSGQADLSASQWTLNEERAELFEVSDPIYDGGGMGIVTRGENWDTAEDLDGKKIGIPQGYLWAEQVKDFYGTSSISEYQSDDAVLDDVAAGRIDAGLVSLLANTWRVDSQNQYSDLKVEDMEPTADIPYTQDPPMAVVLIEDGNTELRDATNTVLEEFRESGGLGEAFEEQGLDSEWAEIDES